MDHRVADLFQPNPEIFNKVIAVDLPGHGSTIPSNARTIEEYADFISIILDQLDMNNLHLCGHSMGGLVCMALAASNRKIFKSVTLFNCQYKSGVEKALSSQEIKWIKYNEKKHFAFPRATHKLFKMMKGIK